MKTIKLFGVLGILLVFSSCHSLNKSTLSTPVFAPNALIKPIYADVEVKMDKKLIGTASATYFFGIRMEGDTKYADGMHYSVRTAVSKIPILSLFMGGGKVGKVKAAAAYNAMANSDADIIVNPHYSIEKRQFLMVKQVNAEVTGFAGYFTKFYQKKYESIDKSVGDYLDERRRVELEINYGVGHDDD